jgi:uncharacterized protein YggE
LQPSQQLQQSQTCPQAALLADAQAQAKQVAAAAGVSAGVILSMAEGSTDTIAVPTVAYRFGDFTAGVITSGVGYASLLPSPVLPTPQPTCSLTVQFQLM